MTGIKRLFPGCGSFCRSAASISIIFIFLIVRILKNPTNKKLHTKKQIVSKTVSGNNIQVNW